MPAAGSAKPVVRPVKPHQLSGVATKSYSVASAWDKSAKLDEQQLRLIDSVAEAIAQRPYPAHLADEPDVVAEDKGGTNHEQSYAGNLEEAVLNNANQFHKWHAELEAACATETEEKYQQYAKALSSHLEACEGIQRKVDQTLQLFDALLHLHQDVSTSTTSLTGACEQLMAEKGSLSEFADALRARLKFFDEYEAVAGQFAAAVAAPETAALLPLLTKLDDCIGYVAANPQYADAVSYANKFRQLQARALGLVKGRMQLVLRNASQNVLAAVAEAAGQAQGAGAAAAAAAPGAAGGGLSKASSGALAARGAAGSAPTLPEGLEVSLLYVRFRAAAEPHLREILIDLHARTSRPEYARLMSDCHSLYCTARQQLVSPFVASRLSSLGAAALPQLLREGAEQLLRVAQLEAQLMEQLFDDPSKNQHHQPLPGEMLRPLLEPLGQLLYDTLRPRLVQLQDVDLLCELIDILHHEVLVSDNASGHRLSAVDALRPILSGARADLQERLIYRAHAFIKDEVAGFMPGPADTNYPARLETLAAADQRAAAEADGEISPGEGGAAGQASDPYQQWYAPVRTTLLLLSKLYRCVDGKIFAGLAQDAIAACTASVTAASKLVAKGSGPLDSQLFIIQHLLFLREQIAPFEVDFAIMDVDLDFTHMRDHIRRIMTGEASVFTLSSSNAMVQMLGKGGPRVVTAQLDSKRDLEAQLKAVCEGYIMGLTKMAVEPLLGFLTKVTAVRVAARANPQLARPLKDQAFGAPEKLAELVTAVNSAMSTKLPAAVAKTKLYLPNPATRGILFRPVKSNIAEAHGQIAQLLEAEYPPDQAGQVPLMQPDALGAVLDTLS